MTNIRRFRLALLVAPLGAWAMSSPQLNRVSAAPATPNPRVVVKQLGKSNAVF
jgi:hypothetical protein